MNENLAITTTSMTYDNLIVAGTFPIVTDALTTASGNSYKRGTVLGVITTSGKAVKVDSSKTDGSETAYAILSQDVDATSADTVAPVYLTGEFNSDALIFGGTDTQATHKSALRKIGIFIKKVV
ncbi:head decoration protein [Pelosinus sp. UFO1]|uniref:head decoration protein n=1 Tax=Pelosinus sp. UFO1 TaxID=484770 RepID=UPI0004D0CBE5|nr:head decoration protein [Pelosinus sp. UFO1]AIF51250.1 lambda head decoration protein D HDPD [Pelosinus sp. UFO1]